MNYKYFFFIFIVLAVISDSADSKESNEIFSIRGWDISGADHIEKISQASEFGINTITLSHDLIHELHEEVLNDQQKLETLSEICAEAQSYDMDVYAWTRQISNPPDHLIFESRGYTWLDFEHKGLWSWMESQYEQLFTKVPCIDGVVLFFTESDFQLHRGPHEPQRWTDSRRIKSNMTSDERMAKVINTIHAVHKEHDKQLIVRDFFRTPMEYELFYETMQEVPEDVIVFSRHKPNDFRYNYPHPPSYGRFDERTHIVELEPSREGAVDHLKQEILKVHEFDMDGIVPRIRYGRSAFRDFNIFVYNHLITDPYMELDPLWEDFFLPRLNGDEEALAVTREVLEMAPDIEFHNDYTLGFYLGKRGRIEDVGQSDSRLESEESGIMWTENPALIHIEKMLREGGPEIMNLAQSWHKAGERLARKALDKLEESEEVFSGNQLHSKLMDYFEYEYNHARSRQYWIRSYLALNDYRNNPGSRQAIERVQTSLNELQKFIETGSAVQGTEEFEQSLIQEIERITTRQQ